MTNEIAFASSFFGTSVQSANRAPATTTRRPHTRLSPRAIIGSRTSQSVETEQTYEVTVQTKKGEKVIEVDGETDLRRALLSRGVDVYTLGGKLRNCGGGGQCGTCLISIEEGDYNAGYRTPREEHVLADKPSSWRLACRTKIRGDVTIRTKPQA